MVNLPKRVGAPLRWRRRRLVESVPDIRDLNRCRDSPEQRIPLVGSILDRHRLGPMMGNPVSDGRPA